MLTEAEKLEIDGLLEQVSPNRLSKLHLKKLQKIRVKVTGKQENGCLCATADRLKFYNEFLVWYQKYA
jgi:hypothetical protein